MILIPNYHLQFTFGYQIPFRAISSSIENVQKYRVVVGFLKRARAGLRVENHDPDPTLIMCIGHASGHGGKLMNPSGSGDDTGAEASETQESEEEGPSNTGPDKVSYHRSNTTMHVCWHRQTSVSMNDHIKSVHVSFTPSAPRNNRPEDFFLIGPQKGTMRSETMLVCNGNRPEDRKLKQSSRNSVL